MRILTGIERADLNTSGWSLSKGSGLREFIQPIEFPENYFYIPPEIAVSLSGFDIINSFNARLGVTARNINSTGFDLVYMTWADTIVSGAQATWIAISD